MEILEQDLVNLIVKKIQFIYIKELNRVSEDFHELFSPYLWESIKKMSPLNLLKKYGKFIRLICEEKTNKKY